jgi:pantetheine-phosphate adenylyltransferase
MSERLVLYPGSFDPFTLGHLDIATRALRLFDRVVIAVAADGKASWLPLAERLALVRAAVADLERCEVTPFEGLLVAEVRRRRAAAVVRGIRSAGDYEHEWSLANVNGRLDPHCETVCLLSRPEYAAISSSLVREVARHGGALDALVPGPVALTLAAGR